MTEQPVRYIEVAGQRVPVYLDRWLRLAATVGDAEHTADTVEQLKDKLAKVLRRAAVECAIPVVLYGEDGLRRDVLRRAHATRRGTFLFASGPIENPRIVCLGEQLTDAEIREHNALVETAKAAEKNRDDSYRELRRKVNGGEYVVFDTRAQDLLDRAAESPKETA